MCLNNEVLEHLENKGVPSTIQIQMKFLHFRAEILKFCFPLPSMQYISYYFPIIILM